MDALRVTTIQQAHRLLDLDLRNLWEFRELLGFLIWRDIKVRYRQTAVGIAWFALQPILATLIFTLVFGRKAFRTRSLPTWRSCRGTSLPKR
jgi:homopolymeric O-antigen transport system permease protein